MKKKIILAIIPARKGSKGLKNKNSLKINGKSLVEHTINQAKKSKYISHISVSTDSKKIMNVSKKYNVWCEKLRPRKISLDNSKLYHAINFVINNINLKPEIIVELHPTHVFRTTKLIDNAIDLFIKNYKNFDSLISVGKIESTAHEDFSIKIKNKKIFYKGSPASFNRHKLRNIYRSFGIILISKVQSFKKNKSMIGKNCLGFVIKNKKLEIDINDIYDFNYAKSLI